MDSVSASINGFSRSDSVSEAMADSSQKPDSSQKSLKGKMAGVGDVSGLEAGSTSLHVSKAKVESTPGNLALVSRRSASPQVLPTASCSINVSAVSKPDGLVAQFLAYDDVDIARLAQQASKTFQLLSQSIENKKSEDAIKVLLDQMVSQHKELLRVVAKNMEQKGQADMPLYHDVKKAIDEFEGGSDQSDSAGENVCWQRVVENKGTLGSHTLGGGLFLAGIGLLYYGAVCEANGGKDGDGLGFLFSAGNQTYQSTTVAPKEDSGGCNAVPAFVVGGFLVILGGLIMLSGLIFNPPRVCRPWCDSISCHRPATRHSPHDVESPSRSRVVYHSPESASVTGDESVTIQSYRVRSANSPKDSLSGNTPADNDA